MIQMYYTNRDHLDRYRNPASKIKGRVEKSHKEHLLIMKALEQRKSDQVEIMITRHLHSVLEEFLQSQELKSFCRQM